MSFGTIPGENGAPGPCEICLTKKMEYYGMQVGSVVLINPVSIDVLSFLDMKTWESKFRIIEFKNLIYY